MRFNSFMSNCNSRSEKLSISQIDSNTPGEDRYCAQILSNELNIKLYTVIDGHGGFLAADLTSSQLLDIIIDKMFRFNNETNNIEDFLNYSDEIVHDIIIDSFQSMDSIILKSAVKYANSSISQDISVLYKMKEPIFQLAGCCVVVSIILGTRVFVAHCGDCRALVFSKVINQNDSPRTDSCREDFNTNECQNSGGPDYYCNDNEFELKCITTDHSCSVTSERDLIKSMTSDLNPLRPSITSQKKLGNSAPDRVAGSLAITRALGDGYLKVKELSMPMYVNYLPYITSEPTIARYDITNENIYLILASDGLFNYLSSYDCHSILKDSFTYKSNNLNITANTGSKIYSHYCDSDNLNKPYRSYNNNNFNDEICRLFLPDIKDDEDTSNSPTKKRKLNEHENLSISDLLIKKSIELAFKKSNISINLSNKVNLINSLRNMKYKNRRDIIDDITVMTIGL